MKENQCIVITLPECLAHVPVEIRRSSKSKGIVFDIVDKDDSECVSSPAKEYAFIWRQSDYLKIRLDEIIWIEANGSYSRILAAIRAVLKVETGDKGGFLKPGMLTILFEGHVFWSQLSKRGIAPATLQSGNEDILYPKWTKVHYKGGIKEYERLYRARSIHREAADSSASWGLAQIMGFNYSVCGCGSVAEFVEQMSINEGRQLELFARFIQSNRWDGYLRSHNWTEFARRYNGPGYAQNQYDIKLAAAYVKYK